ncbi:MAG: GMC family oxidoreductase [Bdellovibrionota bacterium]
MYDFAIVGSGVSGGRVAYELTKGGAKCLLLEAGREFGKNTFPKNEMDYSTQLFWGGGLEVTTGGNIGLLRAKCLGGTSIVNQALLDRFDDLAWSDWRAASHIAFFNANTMADHYDASAKKLKIGSIPVEYYNKNAMVFTRACNKLGYNWSPLQRAQADCRLDQGSDCIVCLGGCPRDSKQSSLVTTIRWAREAGLEVRSEFEVVSISPSESEVRVQGYQGGDQTEVIARQVVLAAGALGNTGILLRSGLKSRLPALGKRFACHPQYMSYAVFDEPIDAHKGAFQSVKSDDKKMRAQGFKLENVFAPPIGTAMLMPGFGQKHMKLMKKYRYLASMEVAIRDDASGVITLGSNGKLKVQKPLTASDREKTERGLATVRELFAAAGAKEVISCTQAFGLHLMGGCSIGVDGAHSVVDPEFRVHGYKNIFIADSSIFPGAPGINPSFTIMALSHRASQEMLQSKSRSLGVAP